MTDMIKNEDLPALIGISRQTIYELRAKGEFIEPVRLSARRIAWRRSDVLAWLASR